MSTTRNAGTCAAWSRRIWRSFPPPTTRLTHGAERRLELCPRHATPYERRDSTGRPHCRLSFVVNVPLPGLLGVVTTAVVSIGLFIAGVPLIANQLIQMRRFKGP
jgi:hypothetical protein